jgi:catechol 2,3-dioxygenase-like lactoylglutathione lyase family enzyme
MRGRRRHDGTRIGAWSGVLRPARRATYASCGAAVTLPGQAWRLARFALNVGDLAASIDFYGHALGFTVAQAPAEDPGLATLLGVTGLRSARLRRGSQILELCACDPAGAAMPDGSRSNDLWFQHCALVSTDIAADYARLLHVAFTPVSRRGPQTLPGGITAFKFRDPDGHPLELIGFPTPDPATLGGIDHSAISVADPERSIAFYASQLGLRVTARQRNQGPAQDALDGLDDVAVDVVALAPAIASPHVELLSYRRPPGRAGTIRPGDIAASRLVFAPVAGPQNASVTLPAGGGVLRLLHDPDGHIVLLDGRA